jgi:hypothetical protein
MRTTGRQVSSWVGNHQRTPAVDCFANFFPFFISLRMLLGFDDGPMADTGVLVLVYRELDQSLPTGEEKRAKGRASRTKNQGSQSFQGVGTIQDSDCPMTNPSFTSTGDILVTYMQQLVDSLINSYEFKADGLVKKLQHDTGRSDLSPCLLLYYQRYHQQSAATTILA